MEDKVNVLTKASIEAMNELMQWIRSAVQFGMEQAPDVAQQFLAYEMFKARCLTFIWGGIVLLIIILTIALVHSMSKEQSIRSDGPPASLVLVVGFFIAAMFSAPMFDGIFTWAKISMAPKVYLLQGLADIVR